MTYVTDIEKETLENKFFRKVLFTAPHLQLVVMTLGIGEEIGEEVHSDVTQFIRIEEGEGKAVLSGTEYSLKEGSVVIVPAGTRHNIINVSNTEALKLYTIYTPPEHPDGTVHKTKEEAMEAEKHEHA